MLPIALSDRPLAAALAARLVTDDPITGTSVQTATAASGEISLANLAPYITSKLTRFYAPAAARRMLCQPSCLDFGAAIEGRSIVLVHLARAHLGAEAAALIARQIVLRLTLAAMTRGVSPSSVPHFLYADEFHHFATRQFAQLLSEARKFRLGLVLAHQHTSQLVHAADRQVLDAVLGNAGTVIAFRVGALDADLLEGVMMPRVTASDIAGPPDHVAYVRSVGALGNVPFSLRTRPPIHPTTTDHAGLRERAKSRYAMPREAVDAAIVSALEAFKNVEQG